MCHIIDTHDLCVTTSRVDTAIRSSHIETVFEFVNIVVNKCKREGLCWACTKNDSCESMYKHSCMTCSEFKEEIIFK